jgi:tripartite-type tricarboxylate transporter receptor subunit TctC
MLEAMKLRRGHVVALLLGAALSGSAVLAREPYPSRPVRLIAPIAPGGAVDAMARSLAHELAARFGQPVVVDNRPGAGGSLGAELTARATPDGHTLMVSGSAFVLYTLLFPARYDPLKDFTAITQLVEHPYVMVLNTAVPAGNVRELVALANKEPGALNYASSGNGSLVHLSGELFKSLAGVSITHIPYKGLAAALPDMFAGRVHMTFSSIMTALPHIKAARLRPIGVTSRSRTSALPEVPTLEESGLAGFEVTQWYGVFAPAALPQTIASHLQREIAAFLRSPAMTRRIAAEGSRAVGNTSAEFSANIRGEIGKWRKLVAQIRIKPE